MDREQIEKYLSYGIKGLFTLLIVLFILSLVSLEANKKSPEEIARILEETKEMRENVGQSRISGGGPVNKNLPQPWPPKMNVPYPDFALYDQSGRGFSFSDLKGRVVAVEFVDVSSPVSQAQSGAAVHGAYYAAASRDVDQYALPFFDVLKKYANAPLVLPNPQIVELKVLIYGENGQASRDDAMRWAQHFKLKRSDNIIVAVPQKDLRGKDTTHLIGGYQLVDRNNLLRVDSAGPIPKHNLNLTLAPLVPKLVQ